MVRFFIFLCVLFVPLLALAEVPQTAAKHAVVLDATTGQILFEKDAKVRIPTASMSKMATLYVAFDALKSGRIKMEDTFTVSEKAWKMEGSRTFLPLGANVTVSDLIQGIAVQSGNDACIVLAEGLAGSEGEFVTQMNAAAAKLGLLDTRFANAEGLPHPQHYSTALDLAHLGMALIRDFPQYYSYLSQEDFTYNGIKQMNRNPLLYRKGLGADGIKTGHTQEAGYGLVASAVSPVTKRRVVVVVAGLPDEPARAEAAAALTEWGLSAFTNTTLFTKGQDIVRVPVARGTTGDAVLTSLSDVIVTLPRGADGTPIAIAAEVRIAAAPLIAPLQEGKEVARLHITWEGGALEIPLFVKNNVKKSGFLGRIAANIGVLLR